MYIDGYIDCGVCRLRAFRANDATSLARHADNPKVARYLRDRFPRPYSVEDARRFFDYAAHTHDECVACIEVNDEGRERSESSFAVTSSAVQQNWATG